MEEAVDRMEARIKATGEDVRGSQPTPANIEGGLTTLEEKSLGSIEKTGKPRLQDVLENADFEGTVFPARARFRLDTMADNKDKFIFVKAPEPTWDDTLPGEVAETTDATAGITAEPNSENYPSEAPPSDATSRETLEELLETNETD